MKQTGELLRQARENAKLSLSEVALSTKINPKILNAIENGETSNLPAKTFLKGFIRSYALFLKMDADEVMKVFNAESSPPPTPQAEPDAGAPTPAPAKETEKPQAPVKQRRVDDDESFSGLRAIAVTVIVVLIGVIIGVRELVEKYQREKVVDTTAELKVSPLAGAEKKAEPKAQEPKADANPTAKPQEPAPQAKPAETKPAETKPAETKPALVVAPPVPVPAPAPAPPPTAEAEPAETPPAQEPKPDSILKSVRNEIILEALDKVEVKFRVNGQVKIVSLGPTQVHTIVTDEPTVLDFSDGGRVNIILNGRERGVPGDLGKPKQVKIP